MIFVRVQVYPQATLSTLGNRIMDLQLPIHNDQAEIEIIVQEVQSIISLKKELKKRTNVLIDKSL